MLSRKKENKHETNTNQTARTVKQGSVGGNLTRDTKLILQTKVVQGRDEVVMSIIPTTNMQTSEHSSTKCVRRR